jgi:hypothetical protein
MRTAPTAGGTGVAPVGPTPKVIYGWRNVPPPSEPWGDMSRTPRNALGGVDFVCTTRRVDPGSGRWVCMEYTVIQEYGTRVIEPSDPNATHARPTP